MTHTVFGMPFALKDFAWCHVNRIVLKCSNERAVQTYGTR